MAFFDANTVTELPDHDILPAGSYRCVVKDSTLKTTKSGTGKFVAVQLEVVGGPMSNRIVFDNFNIENPSARATEIGRSNFSKFLHACSRPVINAPEEVQGAALTVTLTVGKDKLTGEPRNNVKKYESTTAPTPATNPADQGVASTTF